jgi:hypothetical protein
VSAENEIDLDKLARLPLGLGCATLVCLALALVLIVVGLFVTWHAHDMTKLADDIADRGRLVAVEVTGKDVSHISVGVNKPRTTQFWLRIAPVDEADAGDDAPQPPRVAVGQKEHDAAAIGDRLEIWRVDDRYVFERPDAESVGVVGYVLLGAGGAGIVISMLLLMVIARRVRAAALGP